MTDAAARWSAALRADGFPVREVSVEEVGSPHDPAEPCEPELALVRSICAASVAAARAARTGGQDIPEMKRRIDAAATRAAETEFARSTTPFRVSGGEGPRDLAPGAVTGQSLGPTAPDGRGLTAILDYVDGTTLAAMGLDGALSLGGYGTSFTPVPDYQALAVLTPKVVGERIDLSPRPEDSVASLLDALSEGWGRPSRSLRVLTHSDDTGPFHTLLIRRLRDLVDDVVVPSPVIIEAPYLLQMGGVAPPRIDTIIAVIGLTELAFCSVLLDLLLPDFEFRFRLASVDGFKRREADDLDPAFEFSVRELSAMERLGWDPGRQYTSRDLVPAGSSEAAAVFPVTAEPAVDLPAPTLGAGGVRTEGFLCRRDGHIVRLRLLLDIAHEG